MTHVTDVVVFLATKPREGTSIHPVCTEMALKAYLWKSASKRKKSWYRIYLAEKGKEYLQISVALSDFVNDKSYILFYVCILRFIHGV